MMDTVMTNIAPAHYYENMLMRGGWAENPEKDFLIINFYKTDSLGRGEIW
jgi:hypothetical protein